MSYCKECLALRESEKGNKKWDKEEYTHKQKCQICGEEKMCAWVNLDALSNIGLGEVDSMAEFAIDAVEYIKSAKEALSGKISDISPMQIYNALEEAEKRISQIGNCLMDANYDFGCELVEKVGSGGYYRRPVGNIEISI